VVTVTATAHGLAVGAKVDITLTGGSAASSGTYNVATVADANTFTVNVPVSRTTSSVTNGAKWNVSGTNQTYGSSEQFAGSCGLIFQREAAGVVEAIGPQVQTTSGDVSVIYQGDVILGRLAMGADYLNPAACVELYVGTKATTVPAF